MMKMRAPIFPFLLLCCLSLPLIGCGAGNGGQSGGNDDGSASLWKMRNYPVSKVEVYTEDNVLVETYEYTYDEYNRLLSLRRTDNMVGNRLLDLKYSYPSSSEMVIAGTYYYSTASRTTKVRLDAENKQMTYVGNWKGAWFFQTTFNNEGAVLMTSADVGFGLATASYATSGNYIEAYTRSGGDVVRVEIGTHLRSTSIRQTAVQSAPTSAIMELTYTELEDRQNFGVYLFTCEFPVWYAKELPGNKHLPSEITWRNGEVPSHLSTRLTYEMDEDGDIRTAIRTDFNDEDPVLVRRYSFYYK